jgi:hypothetical protein
MLRRVDHRGILRQVWRQRSVLLKFLYLLIAEGHVLGDGYWSTDFEVTPPYRFSLPARTPQGVAFNAHVGRDGVVLCEHVSEALLERAIETSTMQI